MLSSSSSNGLQIVPVPTILFNSRKKYLRKCKHAFTGFGSRIEAIKVIHICNILKHGNTVDNLSLNVVHVITVTIERSSGLIIIRLHYWWGPWIWQFLNVQETHCTVSVHIKQGHCNKVVVLFLVHDNFFFFVCLLLFHYMLFFLLLTCTCIPLAS